jgi:hypothetical protein
MFGDYFYHEATIGTIYNYSVVDKILTEGNFDKYLKI